MEKQELSPRAREALEKLNLPEAKIDALAEKQVDVELNTVEKEAETVQAETSEPETVEVKKTLWEQIKGLLSKPEVEEATEPDAAAGGEETQEAPAEAQETKEVDMTEMVKEIFDAYTEAFVEAVSANMAQKDAQLVTLGEAVLMLSGQIQELKAPIEDSIEKRLAELPRVVKAAPSATAVMEKPIGRRASLSQSKATGEDYLAKLIEGVQAATEQYASNFDKVQV